MPHPQINNERTSGRSREDSLTTHTASSNVPSSSTYETRQTSGDLAEKRHTERSVSSNQPLQERMMNTIHSPDAGVLDAVPGAVQVARKNDTDSQGANKEPKRPRRNHQNKDTLPPPKYTRRPPPYPTLAPEFQYCRRENLIKPMRAHHCRTCGTVGPLRICSP